MMCRQVSYPKLRLPGPKFRTKAVTGVYTGSVEEEGQRQRTSDIITSMIVDKGPLTP